jgi:hypothetical protein
MYIIICREDGTVTLSNAVFLSVCTTLCTCHKFCILLLHMYVHVHEHVCTVWNTCTSCAVYADQDLLSIAVSLWSMVGSSQHVHLP